MRNPCGGYVVNNTVIEWARTKSEFDRHFLELSQYGVIPEMNIAKGLAGRWNVTEKLINHTRAHSVLDVGGFGHYKKAGRKDECINITPHKGVNNIEVRYYLIRTPLSSS